MAAITSDAAPFKGGASGRATSLYSQKKYATKMIEKLKISGIRNTAYTGTTEAPRNASVNASAGPARERADEKM